MIHARMEGHVMRLQTAAPVLQATPDSCVMSVSHWNAGSLYKVTTVLKTRNTIP